MNGIQLGKEGKDKITGFKGIITSEHKYLTGCTQYGITPLMDANGKMDETRHFDEGRIEVTGDGINPDSVKSKDDGCDNREWP